MLWFLFIIPAKVCGRRHTDVRDLAGAVKERLANVVRRNMRTGKCKLEYVGGATQDELHERAAAEEGSSQEEDVKIESDDGCTSEECTFMVEGDTELGQLQPNASRTLHMGGSLLLLMGRDGELGDAGFSAAPEDSHSLFAAANNVHVRPSTLHS